ncbi:helix-turn-helix transcriptional regulator [Atopomonas hussainii]|uniref:helix-turn-helix transcriptional regulator n=1 Tax=Atopomonas hussainii TaxID=1429083 RepID=UPI0009001680|nr:helix-turn-helix transcriptional regulator [Atopomonas hussainii]
MHTLIHACQTLASQDRALPFALYSAVHAQHLRNVTIAKPLLVVVLSGSKALGYAEPLTCRAGDFALLANNATLSVRNLPEAGDYLALLIEFEYADFAPLTAHSPSGVLPSVPSQSVPAPRYVHGTVEPLLHTALLQFVQWSACAPAALWPLRRQELLQLLAVSGYPAVSQLCLPPSLSQRVYAVLGAEPRQTPDAATLAAQLAMSEATLRRRLSAEGTNLQTLKDSAKLSRALHLLQTGFAPIGQIAEQCGYHSQSRFTEKFKQHFGLTPTALRRTRLRETG